MDRVIVYPGQAPRSLDLLLTNRNAMTAVGMMLTAVLGTATVVDGLAISPTAPASLQVQIGQGAIYSLQQVDPNAYSSLPADAADTIVKQGLVFGTTLLTLTPPATSGQSQVYLVQVAFQEVDGGPVLLPYYNASAPAQPWQGPNNGGTQQSTLRQGQCVIGLKAGVPAATGSQVTPAPDAGYVGLYTITLANGAATVTSANIATLQSAPFVPVKLPGVPSGVQGGQWLYAATTYVSGNYTASLSPVPTAMVQGMEILALFSTANSVTSPTLNLNGLGYKPIVKQGGGALSVGDLSGYVPLIYDGANWRVNGPAPSDISGVASYAVDTGAVNALVVAPPTALTSPIAAGTKLRVKAKAANTAAATIAVSGLAAVPIIRRSGVALKGGEWAANDVIELNFDGTSFQMVAFAFPAYAGSSISGSYAYYTTLPNGIILQWAGGGSIASGSYQDFVLPLAFPAAGIYVGATLGANGVTSTPLGCGAGFNSASSVRLYNYSAYTLNLNFFAVGY